MLGVGAQQIVAAHARLAGDAGRDHHHVAVGRVGVIGRAGDVGVEAHDRGRLAKSSALPLGMVSVWGMSKSTMSPNSAAAHQWAVVAPTLPAPMMLIFARFTISSPFQPA